MNMFFVAGIGIATFIEFLLISKKNKSASDKILTVWIFVILVHLFLFFLWFTGDFKSVPFLLGTEQSLPLVQGVFLYLYVASVTGQMPERKALLLLHFLPAAVLYAFLVPYFLLPADQKILIYQGQRSLLEPYNMIMTVKRYAYVGSGILYVVWSELLLRRHRSNIQDRFSSLEKINLNWLKILTFGMGGIWWLIIIFANDILIFSGVTIFVFLIGFFGVRQTNIFVDERSTTTVDEQKEKYQKSGLTEEASEKLHSQLMRLMKDEAVYRKSDLSIIDLSSKLGVHPNYLSQVINQTEQTNYYDFINQYRIEEFKRLIADKKNKQFTLLSLAHECGFSSKSSFNRCFKKATGLTPTEYAAANSPIS